jgi:hypothetical protein
MREDCHVALDAMVENVTPARVVSIVTSEAVLGHKNPVVRASAARLVALLTIERLGPARALGLPSAGGAAQSSQVRDEHDILLE